MTNNRGHSAEKCPDDILLYIPAALVSLGKAVFKAEPATRASRQTTGEKMDQLHAGLNLDCGSDTDLLRIVFQGKWRLRVLQEVVKGPIRLSELRRAVPECTKKVLIDTLHGLEELGWIKRQEYPTKLRKVEYSLKPECEQDVRRAIAIASSAAAAFSSDAAS